MISAPEIDLTDELSTFLEDLHNGEIGWFFDGVWCAKIDDKHNGYKAEGTFRSLLQAAEWLQSKAIELYPDNQ